MGGHFYKSQVTPSKIDGNASCGVGGKNHGDGQVEAGRILLTSPCVPGFLPGDPQNSIHLST
jgi:hypothetical protein